ncbi:MAG: NAD(P)/FAD-dependent oxidoreductase [Desulfurococcales archaeon]|nr:NAD(P)/FAD-dependent oxidoreductase [Desulfurococcales archaeon]
MGREADVAVVGLGPAGATLAFEAARRGLEVSGFDVSRRYTKACGNATPAEGEAALYAEYFDAVKCEVNNFSILVEGREAAGLSSRRPLWVIMDKESVVAGLREAAEAEGAVLAYSPSEAPGGRVVIDARGPYAAGDYILLYRIIAKAPGWEGGTALIDFRVSEGGLYWVFPDSHGVVNAGAGFIRPHRPVELRDAIKAYLERLLGPYEVLDERAAPLAVLRPPRLYGKQRIYIGEAAGLVNALSGEGIRQAVASALRLAEALHSCDVHPECSKKRYRTYTRSLEMEASLSKFLLRAVLRAGKRRSSEALEALSTGFWRDFLRGRLARALLRVPLAPRALLRASLMLASAAISRGSSLP